MKRDKINAFALKQEQLLSIPQAARALPKRDNGRHVHPSTVWRWIRRGVRGARLETIRIGGSTYTSVEALQRFAAGSCGESIEQSAEVSEPIVEAELRGLGLLPAEEGFEHV